MWIDLLGVLEVRDGDTSIKIPGEKPRTVLAVLALTATQPRTREQLIAELWPEDVPQNAENSLHGHVARLRKLLADRTGRPSARELIQTSHLGYSLALPADHIDCLRFYRMVESVESPDVPAATVVSVLSSALALWRGPALVDVGHGAICQSAYVHLTETRLAAYERLFDSKLVLGLDRAIIPEVERLHSQYPLREYFCEQLMTALHRSGRQADALDAYHRTRRRLADDLGLEPGRGLQRKFREVL